MKPKVERAAVPFTDVKFTDRFWSRRLEINRKVTLPACFHQCEITNRIRNFEIAGGLAEGKFEGIYFNDSDVYKVIEGAAYSLSAYPDPELDRYLDDLIAKIAAAQQPDGYLNTYYTLVEPDKRWTDLPVRHELYCAGHLFEAAVAHYRATGKRNLLDVAIRFADHIDSIFGEGKRVGVPGHEEIELALVKLYQVTEDIRYLNLAKFFIDKRGYSNRDYAQDHIPVREQREIVGHAVRAMYLYAGVADIAAYTQDEALFKTMDSIWRDVTLRKMYVTGGIGPSAHNEGFTVPYDLPNASAYAETCAAIGMALWNHRLFLLHGESKYVDVLERVLYNGLISGVSMEGDKFFYVNPLASYGKHHRQPWYGCACCPTNVVRFVPQISEYVYAVSSKGVYVNLYASNVAKAHLGDQEIDIEQETDYPWNGRVKITLKPTQPTRFALFLRKPEWCPRAEVQVNGQPADASVSDAGYITIEREWRSGDLVQLDMPMTVNRVLAHPNVQADAGRVALSRGPIVYCLEAVDNGGSVLDVALPRNSEIESEFREDLLGGVQILKGKAFRSKPVEWSNRLYQVAPDDEEIVFTAIPYYAWDHREPGEMTVWLPETTILAKRKLPPTIASEGKADASHTYGDVNAINDGVLPSSSNDHSIARHTWWNHKGTQEWVSLTFKEEHKISAVEVYWFDDTGRGECRVPKSWEVQWFDGNDWRPVTGATEYGVEKDTFNRVDFDPIRTKQLRLLVQLRENMSGGVLEWRVFE